jgi:hypothetical protein
MENSCEHGNEPSGSIKCYEILEWLQNWRLLKKSSAPGVSKSPPIITTCFFSLLPYFHCIIAFSAFQCFSLYLAKDLHVLLHPGIVLPLRVMPTAWSRAAVKHGMTTHSASEQNIISDSNLFITLATRSKTQ